MKTTLITLGIWLVALTASAQFPQIQQSAEFETRRIIEEAQRPSVLEGLEDESLQISSNTTLVQYWIYYDSIYLELKGELRQNGVLKKSKSQADIIATDEVVGEVIDNMQDVREMIEKLKIQYYDSPKVEIPFQRLFPARNSVLAEVFYHSVFNSSRLSFVDNIVIQGNLEQGNIYSELVSGNIGVFRLGFGTLLTSRNDTITSEESLQKLIGGGGNAVLNAYYPVFYSRGKNLDLYCQFAPKIAGDLPVLGSLTDEITGNVNLSGEVYVDLTSNNKAVNLFAYFRAGYIFGTPDFYDNLEVDRKGFWFGQLNVGVTLSSNIRISITTPVFSSQDKLQRFPVMIGTQVLDAFSKR